MSTKIGKSVWYRSVAKLGILAIPIALALPAAAQHGGHGGGGGHSGGGSHSGGHSGGGGHVGGGSHPGGGSHSYGGHSYGGYRGGYGYSGSYGRHGTYGGYRHHWGGSYGFIYNDPYYWTWYWGGWFPYWSSVGWGWGWPYDYYHAPGGYYGYYGRPYGIEARLGGRYGIVDTDVNPDECELLLNGKYIGTADDFDGYPDYLYLAPGKYHLEFKLEGYETYAVDLDVHRGERVHLDHKLKELPGHHKLDHFTQQKGMPYGRVFGPDGQPPRDDSWRNPQQRRAPDTYVRPEDDQDEDDFAPDQDRGADREARPPYPAARGSFLRFRVTPADAAIYLDDRYVGTAFDVVGRDGVRTNPGPHTVTVIRPGFKAQTVDVVAKDGGPVDVVVELTK